MEKTFTVTEVAGIFKVSRNAVYKWIQEGKINTSKTPGGQVRILESEIVRIQKNR